MKKGPPFLFAAGGRGRWRFTRRHTKTHATSRRATTGVHFTASDHAMTPFMHSTNNHTTGRSSTGPVPDRPTVPKEVEVDVHTIRKKVRGCDVSTRTNDGTESLLTVVPVPQVMPAWANNAVHGVHERSRYDDERAGESMPTNQRVQLVAKSSAPSELPHRDSAKEAYA